MLASKEKKGRGNRWLINNQHKCQLIRKKFIKLLNIKYTYQYLYKQEHEILMKNHLKMMNDK